MTKLKSKEDKMVNGEYANWFGQGFISGKQQTLKDVLKIIDKNKLPDDNDYRYSNEYVDAWIFELREQIKREIGVNRKDLEK